ncbi:cell cycle progression protein 1-like isoform X2 [Anguilla rostrata]|uniref:cell cycle progression protein 1-like isoform X2 n=1 Tax=Anguilla rostrata TaxID=7938 RepID=UPI0030D5650E
MSESSSDTESSCGWTIISNEGSDIETLGPEHGADSKPQRSESLDGEETQEEEEEVQEEVQQEPSVLQAEQHSESWIESSLDNTLKEETHEQPEGVSEAVVGHVTLCSSSEHSDIMTLEPLMVAEPEASWEEQQDLYLGTSSSSQYTFSTLETTRLFVGHWKLPESLWDLGSRLKGHLSGSCSVSASLPVEPSGRDSSSSSGEEEVREPSPALRRRRVRKSTASTSETEEAKSLGPGQEGPTMQQEQEVQEVQEVQRAPPPPGHGSGTLNKCILLALVIAISMGFGHFYGTVQTQERQKMADKMRGIEPSDAAADLQKCRRERDVIAQSKEVVQHLREDLEEKQAMVLSLTQIMDKITKENHQLRLKQSQQQAQKKELTERLKQSAQEKNDMEFHHRHLATENQQLMSSLEHEEQSLSALQEELLGLRTQIRDLEERGAGADSVLSENQKLKEHLEEEKQRIRLFLSQKEALVAEAQTLRQELDRERKATDQLKEELEQLSGQSTAESDPETEELRARLAELEKKLSFEQQRSDLWERLYVETKEDRAKGDQQPRAKKPRDGIIGKVKDTFDAVKNSTKEFVHHHKEQIKKAKEAVKENLRKFSDSVKSTFRHFKNSASRVFEKARKPQDRKFHERKAGLHGRQQDRSREHKQEKDSGSSSWQARPHKPLHQHPRKSTADTFQADRNTRKPGPTAQKDSDSARHGKRPKGCSGVFDCAYQESMSLFNKALEPIRADEFNQLIHSYLQQEVDHFHHWGELESFINSFFHNGVFIHDQMLFTDFVSGVEDYLEDMDEYQRYNDDVFEDLDDYVYKHFFGDSYSKQFGPSRPIAKPTTKRKQDRPSRHHWQQHRAHPRPQKERKWSKPGRSTGRHMADVKIELGPLPFDPKY